MKVEAAIEALIGREGRYSNNPNDAGGETMWGVTIAVARMNGYTGPMVDMPRATAADIFMKEYFVKPSFDRVFEMSPSVADELFDTGVNMGVGVSCIFLQRCLNALNRSDSDAPLYTDLKVDGNIGAKSIAAFGKYLSVRGSQGELVMLRMLNCLQGEHYISITEHRTANENFVYGWFLNRVVI